MRFDDMTCRGRSRSQPCHRPVGSVLECDGLEGLPCIRKIGTASYLARGPRDKVFDRLQDRASIAAVSPAFPSKSLLRVLKQLLPLRPRKTDGQSR
jgi:hypothetical protein